MLRSLWHCPVCQSNEKKPSALCRKCGANLLLLAKIKITSWQALSRAEEARSHFLYKIPKEPPVSLLQKLRAYFCKKTTDPLK